MRARGGHIYSNPVGAELVSALKQGRRKYEDMGKHKVCPYKVIFITALVLALLLTACAAPPVENAKPSPTPLITPAPAPTPRANALRAAAPLPPPASPTDAPELLASDYLPFEDIFLRYYDSASYKEIDCAIEFFSEQTGLVQRHFTGEDIGRIEVSQYFGGQLMRTYQLTGVDYFQNFMPISPFNERETLIAEPISVGQSWDVPAGTIGIAGSFLVPGGVRRITAVNKRASFGSFGEFSVLEVETRYENGYHLIQQYMRNVGLVAQRLTDGSGLVLEDLMVSAREKGRRIAQNVRFYYVHAGQRRLYYIDRTLMLATNANLNAQFADEWRNVPPGSGLLPLSPDVSVITMYPFLDRLENRVIIRFSDEFVTLMPSDEYIRMLLSQAVANTLCDYYGMAAAEFSDWPFAGQNTRFSYTEGAANYAR